MKTKLFTIGIAFISMNAFAQITVTDTDLVGIGDVIFQAYDSVPGQAINTGNTGANQSWDFSTLQVTELDTTTIISPIGTPYASIHPTANLCIKNDNEYYYINKNASGIGIVGIDNLAYNFPLAPLPLSYGLTYSVGPNTVLDSSMLNMFLPDSIAPLISLNPLHNKIDSFKFTVTITNDFNVDAWGDVTIPMGTYPSLRVVAQDVTTTLASAYCSNSSGVGGSGWYTVPSQIFPAETETTNRYQWWTNDPTVKFLLVDMELDSAGNVISADFLTNPQTSNVAELTENEISIFPIPATYQLNIEAEAENATYKLYDISGKLYIQNAFRNTTKIDLSKIGKGTYLLNITSEKGSVTKKVIVE